MASSKMATARVQPAEAPRILCGKQDNHPGIGAGEARAALGSLMMGSVATRALAQCKVPILLVR